VYGATTAPQTRVVIAVRLKVVLFDHVGTSARESDGSLVVRLKTRRNERGWSTNDISTLL
jgi:hypothetical protein